MTPGDIEVLAALFMPSHEDRQLDRYIRRETWAADILSHPWCPPGFTLEQARRVANEMVAFEDRGGMELFRPSLDPPRSAPQIR